MPSSTRSNRGNQLLFSEDPAHLERSIRKDLRSASIDRTAVPSTDTHVQPSTDTQTAPSTDTVPRSTSFDTTHQTSTDGHLCNATGHKLDEQGNIIPEPEAEATGEAQIR